MTEEVTFKKQQGDGFVRGSIPEYLTLEQVATILQVSPDTVARSWATLRASSTSALRRRSQAAKAHLRIPGARWSGSSRAAGFVAVANRQRVFSILSMSLHLSRFALGQLKNFDASRSSPLNLET